MRNAGLAALFTVLTLSFLGIAAGSAFAGRWFVAVPAAAIGLWMGSFARQAARKRRR